MPEYKITEETLDRLLEYFDWSIKTFKWQHDQSGVEGNYSPQLLKAMVLQEQLQGMKP